MYCVFFVCGVGVDVGGVGVGVGVGVVAPHMLTSPAARANTIHPQTATTGLTFTLVGATLRAVTAFQGSHSVPSAWLRLCLRA